MDHPDGVTAKGQAEVIHITKKVESLLMKEGMEGGVNLSGEKKVFKKKPALLLITLFLVNTR